MVFTWFLAPLEVFVPVASWATSRLEEFILQSDMVMKKSPLIEGSLEVKLPTIWTDEKQSRAEAERREKIRREKSRRERVRRKKMPMRQKVGKSRNTVYFRKVGSLKRRVRSQLAR